MVPKYLVGIGILTVLLVMSGVKTSQAEDSVYLVQREKTPSIAEEEIWMLPIQATGQGEEDFQGIPNSISPCNKSTRYIGMDANAVSSEVIDQPPPDSTAFLILNNSLFTDIRKIGSDREVWTLKLLIGKDADPTLGHFYPELSWDPNRITWDPDTIAWDTNQVIPADAMQLRQGNTEDGPVLVADMRTTKTYQTKENEAGCIPGEGCLLMYTIVFEPAYRTHYLDSDGDDHGDPNTCGRFIEPPLNYVAVAGDCDDTDSDRYPGAQELCDEKDNDCDGLIPENERTDNDFDGVLACADCYDNDPNSYPGAPEICDGKDNDCDGDFDEGMPINVYYLDNDNDGYGDPNPDTIIYGCQEPAGYSVKGNDCNDNNEYANPGILEIKDMGGSDQPVFNVGRNHVTMNPSCSQYDSYALIQDSKIENKVITIHHSFEDSSVITPTTYWFFGQPCGENFIILDNVPYWVFRQE